MSLPFCECNNLQRKSVLRQSAFSSVNSITSLYTLSPRLLSPKFFMVHVIVTTEMLQFNSMKQHMEMYIILICLKHIIRNFESVAIKT